MIFRQVFSFLSAALLIGCASEPMQSGKDNRIEPAPVTPALVRRAPRLGLVLGGGAARGFAHVGVIEVLEEAGLRPALVVGTSAGSLVAALYASGKTPAQLQHIAATMEEAAFADWTLPLFNRGMLRGEALARYVGAQVGNQKIEDLPMALGVVATDLNSGNGVLFQRGDIATAVRASSAVPAVFQPVRINGRDYVDGGLVAPVPVRYARQMGAEIIIAVDISSAPEGNAATDTLHVLLQTFSIMSKSINTLELRDADIVVRPVLAGVSSADFSARKRSVDAGREAMQRLLPELRRVIELGKR